MSTCRALRSAGWNRADQSIRLDELAEIGAKWGGCNGILFLWAMTGIAGVGFLIFSMKGALLEVGFTLLFLLFGSLLGILPAFLVGGCIGMILALIDWILVSASRVAFFLARPEG